MKSRTLKCITAITLFAALAVPVRLAAQHTRHKPREIRTSGGPSSGSVAVGTHPLNNAVARGARIRLLPIPMLRTVSVNATTAGPTTSLQTESLLGFHQCKRSRYWDFTGRCNQSHNRLAGVRHRRLERRSDHQSRDVRGKLELCERYQ